MQLTIHDHRIQDVADVVHENVTFDFDLSGFRVDLAVNDVGPERISKIPRFPEAGRDKTGFRMSRNLDGAVADGQFREDLYYRLSVIPVQVPPLRERPDDIELLANHFLKKYAPAAGKSIRSIRPESILLLRDYDWPGNVRQLENTIERAVALEMGEELEVELPTERQKNKPAAAAAAAGASGNGHITVTASGIDMEAYVADLERSLLQQALDQSDGVQTRAAELLKLSYRSFRHLMKKYDL